MKWFTVAPCVFATSLAACGESPLLSVTASHHSCHSTEETAPTTSEHAQHSVNDPCASATMAATGGHDVNAHHYDDHVSPFNERIAATKRALNANVARRWQCLRVLLQQSGRDIRTLSVTLTAGYLDADPTAGHAWANDPSPEVRAAMAAAWARTARKDAVAHVMRALRDPHSMVRRAAAEALTHFKRYRDAAIATLPLLRDPSPEVRGQAASTLGFLKTKSAGPLVADLLTDPNADVRVRAAYAIKNMRYRGAVTKLLELAQTHSPTRTAAIHALAVVGNHATVPRLVDLQRDESLTTTDRTALVDALRRLTDQRRIASSTPLDRPQRP